MVRARLIRSSRSLVPRSRWLAGRHPNRHHRLLCHTRLSPAHPRAEIEFIHTALQLDTKNYHTWAYLHWTYAHFSALETKEGAADENEGPADAVGRTGRISREDWEEELRWVAGLLAEDGRNNSAWAWRFFLAFSRPGADASKGAGETERKYALEMAHKIPHNLSAWNYLRGYVVHLHRPGAWPFWSKLT